MTRTYQAAECIFDLLAASGPQEKYDVYVECVTQCVCPEFDETLSIGEMHDAADRALHALCTAGIIVHDPMDGVYDLTDFGYSLTS